jgi:hypothetical protein
MDMINDTMGQVVFSQFIGRISAFSSSSMIIQKRPEITALAGHISPWAFLREALFIPLPKGQLDYGHVLNASFGDFSFSYAIINGVPGALFISYYHSLQALFIYIITQLTLIIIPYILANFFLCRRNTELVFMTMCTAVVAGDAFSFSKMSIDLASYLVLFLFINFIMRWVVPCKVKT